MRAFIVLCLIAYASADKLGYNYHPVPHSDSGLSFNPGAASSATDLSSYGEPAGYSNVAAPAQYDKEFYSFSAPEHEFDDNDAAQQLASSLKKNLRVIFIKSPENKGLENAALALAKHASEQKTAIYVLHKQADINELANKFNAAANHQRQRPEVHFVKYRTQEDAANAQRAIQSQYDQLGGSSQNHNGGVAPVLNFASPAQVHAPAPQAPASAYLPSSIIRRFRK